MLDCLRTLVDQHRQSVLEAERIAYTQDWAAFHESLQIAYNKRASAADRDHHWRVAKLAIRKRRDIDLPLTRSAGARCSIGGEIAPAH